MAYKSNTADTTYIKTQRLLKTYRFIKKGREMLGDKSQTLALIDEAIDYLSDDPYIELLRRNVQQNVPLEVVAQELNMSVRYAQRKKRYLVMQLSLILYGDEALSKDIKIG